MTRELAQSQMPGPIPAVRRRAHLDLPQRTPVEVAMVDSVAGGSEPRRSAPSSAKTHPQRTVRQAYRVSAVRRPPPVPPGVAEPDSPPVATPVSDEEIINALWAQREAFLDRLSALATQAKPGGAVTVKLVDVRPASSVLLDLLYTVQVAGNAATAVAGFTGAVIRAVAEQLELALGAPVAVSAAGELAAAPAMAAAPSSSWDRVAPVLGAIGTGIGVIGFVTFVGGLIVWARLNGTGFPAGPALSVYPKQDLLVIGAQTLVPQVLAAFVVVAVLSAVYAGLRAWRGRLKEEEQALLAGHATLLGGLGMFVFVVLALAITLIPFRGSLSGYEMLLALLGALGLGALAAVIGSTTRRFLYLALTSFVVVGVFMSFVAYWRARDDKKVRGAALIRDNRTALSGIYLTEGSGRVYLARVTLGRDGRLLKPQSRIVGIDKSTVSALAVAGAKPVKQALSDARALGRELCSLQPRLSSKPRPGDCVPERATAPTITPYSGSPATLDGDSAVLMVLPALSQEATGVVSFVTRDRVLVSDRHGASRREQVALSTKPFRAQPGRPIRLRVHLTRRARLAIDRAGGAIAVRLRVVAIGSTGLATRDNRGCVVLRTRARAAAHC